MAHEVSPTARALLALEVIQNSPGVTAQRLGDRLGVTERAARRYVAILREAGLPIESICAFRPDRTIANSWCPMVVHCIARKDMLRPD